MTRALARESVFIYFKANAADDAKILASLRTHRSALLADGIRLSFWRRTDSESAGHATWMETYDFSEHAMESLQTRIAASALTSGLVTLAQGPRHVECFEQIDP